MDVRDLKKELVDICHRASERWLTAGSGGNISVRIPNSDRYLCTATGVTFRDTAVENVIHEVKDKSNIWDVNVEQEYHEEKQTASEGA